MLWGNQNPVCFSLVNTSAVSLRCLPYPCGRFVFWELPTQRLTYQAPWAIPGDVHLCVEHEG